MSLPTLGRNHALLRRVRALRRERTLRDREGVFLAEGVHLAEEALVAGAAVERAFVAPPLLERSDGRKLLERVLAAGWEVHEVAASVLDGLQDARTPQPFLTIVRRPEGDWSEAIAALPSAARPALVVVACGVQDPGNLGALVRTADAAGADLLLSTGPAADLFHPRAVRASAGSILHLRAHAVTELDELSLLERLERASCLTVATLVGDGEPYTAIPVEQDLAILVGAEGEGLPSAVVERAARRVHIPMRSRVNSLSVGAAAAVVLFDVARRRAASPR